MRTINPESGIFVFDTIKMKSAETAEDLVGIFLDEVRDRYRRAAGFVRARVHLNLDGDTMVTLAHWAGEAQYRDHVKESASSSPFQERLGQAEVLERTTFEGTQVMGFAGPAWGQDVGLTVVTTRQVAGLEDAYKANAILLGTGEWKHDIPGFVASIPYISLDGTRYLNNPQWTDGDAFKLFIAAPGIPGALEQVRRLETGPRTEMFCRIRGEVTATVK